MIPDGKALVQPKTALSQGLGPRFICGAMGSRGCWGTQTRSLSPWVAWNQSAVGPSQGHAEWASRAASWTARMEADPLAVGVRGAWPALPEPTGASGSSQFSPALGGIHEECNCHVGNSSWVEGGGGGQVCRTLRGDSWDLKTPSLWFWSIPACGRYSAFTPGH